MLDKRYLIGLLLQKDPRYVTILDEDNLSMKQRENLQLLIDRVHFGEPIPYIMGGVQFFNCWIQLNRTVLIPRVESEILVAYILHQLPKDVSGTLLDLCSGSGCLGLAIKKERPNLHVILSDISSDCIEIAQRNSLFNSLEVEFLLGDLLAPLRGRTVHYVVCNPPYVAETLYDQLEKSVRDFEPKLALIGGKDGLDFYRRLSRTLPQILERKGKVFLEIGENQAQAVSCLFKVNGWAQEIVQDWSGKDRFFFLMK